jgi:hypothetical protein
MARHGRKYGREKDVGGMGLGQYISSYNCTNEHERITNITQKIKIKIKTTFPPPTAQKWCYAVLASKVGMTSSIHLLISSVGKFCIVSIVFCRSTTPSETVDSSCFSSACFSAIEVYRLEQSSCNYKSAHFHKL